MIINKYNTIFRFSNSNGLLLLSMFCFIQLIGISILPFDELLGQCIYGTGYIFLLLFYIFCLKHNKLSLLFACGLFIYFYQVPFIRLFENSSDIYSIHTSNTNMMRLYLLYLIVILLYLPLFLILQRIDNTAIIIKWNRYTKFVYIICFCMFFIMIYYAIINSGGLLQYMVLNKLESSQTAKLSYFTYRPFFLFLIPIGLSSGNKMVKIATFLIMLLGSIYDLLGARRTNLLVAAVFIFLYLFEVKELKMKHLIIGCLLLLFFNFTKDLYYPLRSYLTGNISLEKMIETININDLIIKSLTIGEGNAHIVLAANYLHHELNICNNRMVPNLFAQLVAMIPLTRGIMPYLSAGEYLRLYLHEPWSGLASSQYIVGFITLSYFGIILAFIFLYVLFYLFSVFANCRKSGIKLIFCSYVYTLIYLHREEILIFKDIFIHILLILIINVIYVFFNTIFNLELRNVWNKRYN